VANRCSFRRIEGHTRLPLTPPRLTPLIRQRRELAVIGIPCAATRFHDTLAKPLPPFPGHSVTDDARYRETFDCELKSGTTRLPRSCRADKSGYGRREEEATAAAVTVSATVMLVVAERRMQRRAA